MRTREYDEATSHLSTDEQMPRCRASGCQAVATINIGSTSLQGGTCSLHAGQLDAKTQRLTNALKLRHKPLLEYYAQLCALSEAQWSWLWHAPKYIAASPHPEQAQAWFDEQWPTLERLSHFPDYELAAHHGESLGSYTSRVYARIKQLVSYGIMDYAAASHRQPKLNLEPLRRGIGISITQGE